MTVEEMLADGYVPTAEIAPILRSALVERYGEEFDVISGSLSRILRRWEKELDYAEFDGVDRIFAELWLTPEVWTDKLPHLYYNIVFKEKAKSAPLRCARKGCSEKIVRHPKGGNRKKFCSQNCLHVEWAAKKTGRKTVAGKRHAIRKMVCAKGHNMHGPNVRTRTDANGHTRSWCHTCRIDRQRDNRAARRLIGSNG